ncbi:transglutaminaseTgpA domain-containing protein [Polymorphospora sp. NPDC051019]|uniref:transglutaminaseTgpA domain-containing protein n=1 Tax=Polymorphospora sp. NPDC051019 TaxID=3155725 RepID=UPI0034484166
MTSARTIRALLATTLVLPPVIAFAAVFGRTPTEALADLGYLLPVTGAALVTAVTCVVLAAATRLVPVTRLTVGLALLAGYLVLVTPTRIVDGPYRLLTSVPPIDPSGPELATVALLAGLAALGAVEPVLRGAAVAWALPVPLLVTTAGLALGTAAGAPKWLALAVVLPYLLVLALDTGRARPRPGGDGRHRAPWPLTAAALVTVLAAGVAGSQLGPALLSAAGDPPPVDARDLVTQPVRPREDTSPLSRFPALRSGKLPMRLSVAADEPPQRLRYATLDSFDGTYWTSTATYWRASGRLPEVTPAGPVEVIEDRVRVEEPGTLGWLLTTGRPLEVSVSGLGVDRATGDVVLPDDRPVPGEYTARSVVNRPDPETLSTDLPVRRPPGDLPVSLTERATGMVGDSSGYLALRRMTEHFTRTGGFIADTSARPPAGHGLFQIERLFQDKRGTAEQYASAFAVLARSLGYDARVVVGFRPDQTPVAGRYRITGSDVDAWVEVRFSVAGWVPFYPTPGQGNAERERQPEAEPAAEPEQPAPTRPAPGATTGPGPAASGPVGSGDAAPGWLYLLGVPLAGLLLGATGPALKTAVRARRRRAPDPRGRVLGAWWDTLDRYAESGLRMGPAMTTGEVAASAGRRFPGAREPIRELGHLVDRVVHGPGNVPDGAAERAWRLADTNRRQVFRALPRWRRLLAVLTPPRPRR